MHACLLLHFATQPLSNTQTLLIFYSLVYENVIIVFRETLEKHIHNYDILIFIPKTFLNSNHHKTVYKFILVHLNVLYAIN